MSTFHFEHFRELGSSQEKERINHNYWKKYHHIYAFVGYNDKIDRTSQNDNLRMLKQFV